MKLTNYQTVVEGQLRHQGLSYEDLASDFGTPLYIFDEDSFRQRILTYQEALKTDRFQTQLLYASKALLTRAIAEIVADLGIGQDVVSGGEIYTGIVGGVDPAKMYFHGNNKLDAEIDYAIDVGVGTIVIDNRMEAERVNHWAKKNDKKQRVLLRLNPSVETDTHDYIQTANPNSKFGENMLDENFFDWLGAFFSLPQLEFGGFHCHVGSQISDAETFLQEATLMLEFAHKVESHYQVKVNEINFGGGYGVYYSQEDRPMDMVNFFKEWLAHIEVEADRLSLSLEKVTTEPGRLLVNDSGSILYRIGDLKTTVKDKHYAFVDGGMSDNIRPTIYQAKYEAALPLKWAEKAVKTYTIAGKLCESGDVLIDQVKLPEVESGDLLLVNRTGAYTYSMASNYNRIGRPAMIHIKEGQAALSVRRESFVDLLSNEQSLRK